MKTPSPHPFFTTAKGLVVIKTYHGWESKGEEGGVGLCLFDDVKLVQQIPHVRSDCGCSTTVRVVPLFNALRPMNQAPPISSDSRPDIFQNVTGSARALSIFLLFDRWRCGRLRQGALPFDIGRSRPGPFPAKRRNVKKIAR